MASQGNPLYSHGHQSAYPTRAASATRAQAGEQRIDDQQQQEADIYALYAQHQQQSPVSSAPSPGPGMSAPSVYGGAEAQPAVSQADRQQRRRAGSFGANRAASSAPTEPPAGSLPPLPSQQPLMYPTSGSGAPTHGGTGIINTTRSNAGHGGGMGMSSSGSGYMPRDDSMDVAESLGHDGASMHSRSHLNPIPGAPASSTGAVNHSTSQTSLPATATGNVGGVRYAHFPPDQMSPPGTYSLNSASRRRMASNAATTGEYSEKGHYGTDGSPSLGPNGELGEKHGSPRQLPQGYKTPPSFSRAPSSAWGTLPHGKGGAKNSPYGAALGGAASQSDQALQFAEGDYANNKFVRFWLAIVSRNIVVRWLCFIIPVLALLWIPGICGVTLEPTPRVWEVPLLNWSIWLSIVWVGWWAAMLVAMVGPHVLRMTIGAVAPELRHYIDYLFALKKSLAAFLWSLANWIAFQPLILTQGPADRSHGTGLTLSQITKFLFAIFICSIILVVEKYLIQVIAYNFHRTSYADRISENKFAVRSLVSLYLNSRDIGRSDTLDGGMPRDKVDPSRFIKKTLKNAKKVVTGASTALGTVASEIVGERVMQSNSPQSMVTSALASSGKSRQLARRIFFSFTPSHRSVMLKEDIAPFFPKEDQLDAVYAIFDKDENGDISLEEVEMACLEIHRERQSLASSMRDLDSAVARLDQIFMSLWYILSILIIIGIVSISFSAFVTSGATFVLGLSWLIGGTSQEVLSAVVFLLAKHPYDVGDLITIDGMDGSYVVKEISLLSTVFKKTDGNVTQIPHTVLNTKAIQNYRRSGPTSESVSWDVDFSTDFEQIEALRQRMLEFVEHERRDFLPSCDISVDSFTDQSKITLKSSIPFKSNWANSALKSQRRNKWICALKLAMSHLHIYGPGGNGNPSPDPAGPTEIKLINPEAVPPYRSISSANASPSRPDDQDAPRIPSPDHGSQERGNSQPRSIADEVNRLSLSNRHELVLDQTTDIFDYQGSGNRTETLDRDEDLHAARAQIEGRSTAVDVSPSVAGTAQGRFRPQDLEVGKLQSNKRL